MESKASAQGSEVAVYGFLCESTNVFYAFESLEEYQVFVDWLEHSGLPESPRCDAATAT
jgi:hypothetical protein